MAFYRRAADLGSAGGCVSLGRVLHSRVGASREDFQEAKRWYEKANSEGGVSAAYYNIGLLYSRGK